MRRSLTYPIAMVAAFAIALALAPPASAATVWKLLPTPNPGGSQVSDVTLEGVSAFSATDAWAVGIDQVGSFRVPLAEHWDGTGWQAVSVPKPTNRQAWFSGVVQLSATNAWAVGMSSSPQAQNSQLRTLVEHWNGTAWTMVPSPNPVVGFGADDELNGVAAVSPNDIWAVGSVLDPTAHDNRLLFEHFDGTSWKAVPSPSPPGSEHFASGITAIAHNDVWAVGNSALEKTLAAHWDGTRWSIVDTPSLQDGINPLNDLTGVAAVATDDVWASGFEGNVDNQNFQKPYVLHWDGAQWSLVLTPNLGGEGSRLNAVTTLSATDVWAVGQTQGLDGNILTLTEQFNGSSWSIVTSPSPPGANGFHVDSLSGVASPGSGSVVAVGAREIAGQCCLRTLAIGTTNG
jgi:hypothetical protein